MCSFNNLAQIYYFELDTFDAALQGLKQVRMLMDTCRNSDGAVGFEAQSRDEIILNLLLTKPPSTAGCA